MGMANVAEEEVAILVEGEAIFVGRILDADVQDIRIVVRVDILSHLVVCTNFF